LALPLFKAEKEKDINTCTASLATPLPRAADMPKQEILRGAKGIRFHRARVNLKTI